MIKIIAIVVAVLVADVLILAATKPDTFRVRRAADEMRDSPITLRSEP